LGVDGDAAGVSGLVVDAPTLEVVAGPPAKLLLLLPATARVGDSARLVAAFVDRSGNLAPAARGEVQLEPVAGGLETPPQLSFGAGDGGHKEVSIRVLAPGIHGVRARTAAGLSAESTPLAA